MDYAIHVAVLLAAVLSLMTGRARLAATVLFINIGYNQLILGVIDIDKHYQTLVLWCVLFAVKDLLFLTLFGFRRDTRELIILASFGVSLLFHNAILAQVLTYDPNKLTLFAYRPTVMMYVSIAQIATVFYIIIGGSDWNGGKRVKFNVLANFGRFYSLLHLQTFKVKL